MFEQFQNIDLFPVSFFDVLGNLIVAFVCGIIISLVYRYIYRGASYSVTYVNSLVMLTLITSLVMLVIGNNLARAFGLVGAMSIIRFRTAVRDVQDIVFIFFALAVGMASGVGLHMIALAGTIVISFISILLYVFDYGRPPRPEHMLQLTWITKELDNTMLQKTLKKFCRKTRQVSVKSIGDDRTQAFYHLTIKNRFDGTTLISELKKTDGVDQVNLFLDEDDTTPPL